MVLVNNSRMNENTCGSVSTTINRKISHILETAPTHATKYNKKGFAQQNISTNNTYAFGKIEKLHMNVILM